jgi:Tat protein secretion system quality control protein TatD with DNase activity
MEKHTGKKCVRVTNAANVRPIFHKYTSPVQLAQSFVSFRPIYIVSYRTCLIRNSKHTPGTVCHTDTTHSTPCSNLWLFTVCPG